MYIQKKKTYVEPQVEELMLIEMANLCAGSDSTIDPDKGIPDGPTDEPDDPENVPKPDTSGNVWGD